jgi:hypothetical protein
LIILLFLGRMDMKHVIQSHGSESLYANGNLTKHINKKIASITNNVLNLPQ